MVMMVILVMVTTIVGKRVRGRSPLGDDDVGDDGDDCDNGNKNNDGDEDEDDRNERKGEEPVG